MTGTTTQFNARMDSELKKAGDEALARIGLSPSAAVRALWAKAAARGKDLEEVAALLIPRSVAEKDDAVEVLERGWAGVDVFAAAFGIAYAPDNTCPDDATLLEEAWAEREHVRKLS